MVDVNPGLRQRAGRNDASNDVKTEDIPDEGKGAVEEIVWGKTPDGTVFRVPTTHDVLTALFHPAHPKSHLDLFTLGLLGLQLVLFFVLPKHVAQMFFFVYFAFWRAAYDAGLGWVLTKQSKKRWIVREVNRQGWLDEKRRPLVYNWIRDQLKGKMGKDYSFDDLPLEYNAWLLFRQAVDVILINDFLAYTLFAFTCFRVPEDLSPLFHVIRWVGGLFLIVFNIWVKMEAHHVVKDYGWFWGDCFFERGALVFDGVFEMAPHPMYSVGYAGYYGLSMIVGSYAVLFASLAAHAAQFAFLIFFENPHIERKYGQRKLMSMRTPVAPTDPISTEQSPVSPVLESTRPDIGHSRDNSLDGSTAASATEDDATETEAEYDDEETRTTPTSPAAELPPLRRKSPERGRKNKVPSQHDLLNTYFRRDPITFKNIDLLRASDLKLLLLVGYVIVASLLPQMTPTATLALHFTHALLWRCFHSFGLGALLHAQSERKFLVRHYMKHYFYAQTDVRKGALEEAFANWKSIYNMSLSMTYVSFMALAWKTYSIPNNWTVGDQLLRHTLGVLLIGLHLWTAMQSYEVLGVFGWFFGDFFIEDYPAALDYTGIYRFLNNPEKTMSGAALFGLSLISGSKLVFTLAVISQLSHWWFLSNVENPHMRKIYGPNLRKDAGLTKTIKRVALKNAQRLESGAGKRGHEIKRVAQEFRGTFEKVYEETAEVVEEFLNKSRPKFSEVVQDTKFLLQQSRERLVITRFAQDLSSYDATKYHLSFVGSSASSGQLRFHLGAPIKLTWRAPLNHSRRDWVGIYRVGANKSTLITKTSSLGMWTGVHDEEWDGDLPLGADGTTSDVGSGEIVFSGDKLPWHVGKYEFRYHHDGKYNVMDIAGPVEFFVEKPASYDLPTVRSCLMDIVTLCLDSDPSLVPASSAPTYMPPASTDSDSGQLSDDDFRFWSEDQAKHIAKCIKAACDVDIAYDVILADANVSKLASRILASRELMDR